MWIFSTVGFFSVVQKPDDPQLTVRSRFAGDLDALRERFMPELDETVTTPDADYRYRARIPQPAFAAGLARIAEAIDYDNFKSAVGQRQGHARAHLYGSVWSVLYRAQSRDS